jgi:hypothetical protein
LILEELSFTNITERIMKIKLLNKRIKALLRLFFVVILVGFWGYGCFNTAERFEKGYKEEDIEPIKDVYDQNKVQLITGRIFDLNPIIFEDEINVINLNMMGNDGYHYYVHVAPGWFLQANRITFEEGELITVIGSVTDLNYNDEGEEKEEDEAIQDSSNASYIIIAREVRKEGRTLTARTLGGEPLWYRQGKLRGRQLFIEKYIQDKNAGLVPEGELPIKRGQNITPYSFPPAPFGQN